MLPDNTLFGYGKHPEGNLPYGRLARDVERAFEVYETMQERGIEPTAVTYNSLINACIQARDVEQAFEVYETMQERGIEPDAVTYTSLINACIQARGVKQAFEVYGFWSRPPRSLGMHSAFYERGQRLDR